MFFSICLGKKRNVKVIKFLGILKNYVYESKRYVFSRKKSNVSLNKKVIFVFHTIFKLDFIMQIIYCIIHRCLCSHFILFCSLISVSKKWNIETMLTFPYSYNWQKLTTKWMKKEARSIRVWTLNMQLGKLIVVFWSYFWDNFVVFAFLLSTSIDPASSGSYKNFPTINKCFWLTSIQGLIWKQRATLGLKLDWNISSVVLVLPSTIIA